MVYKKHFTLFDTALLSLAVLILILALFFLPKEAFRITKTTLAFSENWTCLELDGSLDTLIMEFEEANPNVNIKLERVNPDIVSYDVPRENGDFQSGIENVHEIAAFINPMFYNIEMLAKIGLDRPPKTREELIAACKKLRDAGGERGISVSGMVFQDITPWFWAAGLRLETDSVTGEMRVPWMSKPAFETFDFLKRLYDEGIVDETAFSRTESDKLLDFIEGKSAFFIGSTLNINLIADTAPALKFSVTTIPMPANYVGKGAFNITAWEAGIPALSERKETALVFLEFIQRKRSEIAQAAYALPTVMSGAILDWENGGGDERALKARSLYEASDIISEKTIFTDTSAAAAVFKAEILLLWKGERTSKECAEAVYRLNAPTAAPNNEA
ncbi:MAG: extracellular solute-binding protein [Spirochaetaceae bacterium]|jgi:ABC-type glycerol-3-phosphate transport system substrate-binding protein|nr:extracellular solute-binding protein [Spirochaetaceae bacterium]